MYTYLGGPVASAHDLCAARVFEIRQARTFFEMLGKEKVEQSPFLGLLPKLMDNGWCVPSSALELCSVDGLSRYALILNPLVNGLDLLDSQWR